MPDAVGYLAAACMGALTFTYPFGRDQGLYFYIGREWWARGRLPYRDAFDVKTPGIYLLNALSYGLFGRAQWGIRVFDLIAVFATGLLAARFAVPEKGTRAPGLRGLAVFAAAVFYYGYFNYWDTAQCEIWCGVFSLLTMVFARRISTDSPVAFVRRTAFSAGLATGVGALFKPPALLLCAVGFAWLIARVMARARASHKTEASLSLRARAREVSGPVAWFCAGGAVVAAVVIGYFAAKGGLRDLYDVLVVNNRHYVVQGRWANSFHTVYVRMRDGYRRFDPAVTVVWLSLTAGVVHALFRRQREDVIRRGVPVVLLACANVIVLAQMKFPLYHWGVFVAPLCAGTAVLASDAAVWLERERNAAAISSRWRPVHGLAAISAAVVVTFVLSGPIFEDWFRIARATLRYDRGRDSRSVFLRNFELGAPFPYNCVSSERVGDWLRQHTQHGDIVAIRGFEPQIYIVADRHYTGRFFWTTFLANPRWAYRMNDWVAEDRRVFTHSPPRWVVALGWASSGVDSPSYFEPLGYVRVATVEGYVAMEHRGATGTLDRPSGGVQSLR